MDDVFALKILSEKYKCHEKEIDSRRVREGDTGHVQRN